MLPGFDNPWGGTQKKKRKPVSTAIKTALLAKTGGKCQKCGKRLYGLKAHYHHKSGNPSNSRASNIRVLCPDCHSKEHFKKDGTSKKNGRARKSRNPFEVNIPKMKMPRYKQPKFSLI